MHCFVFFIQICEPPIGSVWCFMWFFFNNNKINKMPLLISLDYSSAICLTAQFNPTSHTAMQLCQCDTYWISWGSFSIRKPLWGKAIFISLLWDKSASWVYLDLHQLYSWCKFTWNWVRVSELVKILVYTAATNAASFPAVINPPCLHCFPIPPSPCPTPPLRASFHLPAPTYPCQWAFLAWWRTNLTAHLYQQWPGCTKWLVTFCDSHRGPYFTGMNISVTQGSISIWLQGRKGWQVGLTG